MRRPIRRLMAHTDSGLMVMAYEPQNYQIPILLFVMAA